MSKQQERYDTFERWVNPIMLVLSILFFVIFLVDLSPGLSAAIGRDLTGVEIALWVAFVLEYVVRFALAPSKLVMVRRHLFDLVVILLPMLRPLRVLRGGRAVVRPLRALAGVSNMGRTLATARRIAQRRGAEWFILVVAIATASAGLLVTDVERGAPEANIRTFADGMWWAVSTVSGAGNERYPVTHEGRFVAAMLMLLGLGLFSIVTARVAAFFAGSKDDEVLRRLAAIERRLDERAGRPD